MQTLGSLCALMFVTASACVYPARHRLPELDVQLLDQAVPVREARVGYSWAWGQVACDQSLNAIHADTEGRFILPAKTSWGIGAITGIPDYDRPGWQLCLETEANVRRYFSIWVGPSERMSVRCDFGRAKRLDVCEVLPVQ